eukprot:gene11240-biopygen4708
MFSGHQGGAKDVHRARHGAVKRVQWAPCRREGCSAGAPRGREACSVGAASAPWGREGCSVGTACTPCTPCSRGGCSAGAMQP